MAMSLLLDSDLAGWALGSFSSLAGLGFWLASHVHSAQARHVQHAKHLDNLSGKCTRTTGSPHLLQVLVKLRPGPTCAEVKGDILSQLPALVVVTGVVYAVKSIRGQHTDVPAAIGHVRFAS